MSSSLHMKNQDKGKKKHTFIYKKQEAQYKKNSY
jgi:hypothetical protein